MLIEGQVKVLGMIATGAPLNQTLETLIRLVESMFGGSVGSILLLDEAGKKLRHGAAPNLPEAYIRQIDGTLIGPMVGSCGTAAHAKCKVIVEDIANSPLWADYQALALPHGLRACWSVPIFSATERVLGTFAIYYPEVKKPSVEEIDQVETLAHLASVAIERAQTEEKLQASEARFRALTEKCREGISMRGYDGRIIYASPAIKAILGYDPSEVVGKMANDKIHSDDLSVLKEQVQELSALPGHSITAAYRVKHKNGSWRWVESTFTNLLEEPDVQAIVINYRDITKRKESEAALRMSEERFAKAFNASPQPMAIFEASERRIVNVNEAMVGTFGWAAEEMVGKTPADLDIWVDWEQQGRVRTALALQGSVSDLEIKFRMKSGEVREFLYSAETINLKDQPHVLVVASDITERLRTERALQESEERYRLLFEHGFAGILRATSSGQVIDCNDALARMMGCESREEFLQHDGRSFYFTPAEQQQGVEELDANNSLRNVERLLKRKDGLPVWTLSNYTVRQQREDGVMVWDSVVLDITERKLIEQQLAQSHEQLRSLSARLEMVREEERKRIAREIHDNLGQALTGLKLDFSWIHKNLSRTTDKTLRNITEPKLKEVGKLLEETIQTVRDIATELRPGVLDTLGLCAAIDWQAHGFGQRSGIKCRTSLCCEPQELPVDRSTALFRVFQEILTNIARHSRAKQFVVEVAEAGNDLVLTVRDDGIGVTEEQLRNPKSLGLIGMRERVLAFGGSLKMEGYPGQGTTVHVKMPMNR